MVEEEVLLQSWGSAYFDLENSWMASIGAVPCSFGTVAAVQMGQTLEVLS
jgi:hypothetical protein